MSEKAKKQLCQAGIFTGIVLFFFLALALFVFLGKKSWENGLRSAAQDVLNSKEYTVGKFIPIDNSFNVSAARYELFKGNEPSRKLKAVVLRVASYWGPLPAVFVCDDAKAEFMGIAYMKSSVSKALEAEKEDKQMLYWEKIAFQISQGGEQK